MPKIADMHGALRNIITATDELDDYINRMESGVDNANEFWLADGGYLDQVDDQLFTMIMYAFYLIFARIELGDELGEE